eukprot:augustus_masked-scaffold_7-processed-gene-5.5-mRNA-1 protein AED:0.41 eAED:0.41 QI:0/-1/0/1/-1/1/1/0/963
MFFDGKLNSRKNISNRGVASRRVNRRDLRHRVKKRHLDKKKNEFMEKFALKLQSWYRRWKSNIETRKRVHEEFLRLANDLENANPKNFLHFIRGLNFCFRENKDAELNSQFCRRVLDLNDTHRVKTSLLDKDNRHLLFQFLNICFFYGAKEESLFNMSTSLLVSAMSSMNQDSREYYFTYFFYTRVRSTFKQKGCPLYNFLIISDKTTPALSCFYSPIFSTFDSETQSKICSYYLLSSELEEKDFDFHESSTRFKILSQFSLDNELPFERANEVLVSFLQGAKAHLTSNKLVEKVWKTTYLYLKHFLQDLKESTGTTLLKALTDRKFIMDSLSTLVQNAVGRSYYVSIGLKHLLLTQELVRELRSPSLNDLSADFQEIMIALAFSKQRFKDYHVLQYCWELLRNLEPQDQEQEKEYFLVFALVSGMTYLYFKTLPDEVLSSAESGLSKEVLLWIPEATKQLLSNSLSENTSSLYRAHPSYERNLVSFFQLLQQINTRQSIFNQFSWLFKPLQELDLELLASDIILNEQNVDFDGDEEEEEPQGRFEDLANVKIIFSKLPFTISFNQRIAILVRLQEREKKNISSQVNPFAINGFDRFSSRNRMRNLTLKVQRGNVFQSAFEQIYLKNTSLKEKFKIIFISESGDPESGIDGGGLFKEFMVSFFDDVFKSEEYSYLWRTNDQNEIFPSSTPRTRSRQALQQYSFVGEMLGKALFEGILVAPTFAPFFLNIIVGRINGINDLKSRDRQVYENVLSIKNMTAEEILSLDLYFEVTTEDGRVISLKRGVTESLQVTAENKFEYISRLCHYLTNKEISAETEAFVRGFYEVIQSQVVQMFSGQELQLLIGGSKKGYSISDLKAATKYSGGYFIEDEYIKNFWDIVNNFDRTQKDRFLHFVTSCPRPPLRGFDTLNPPFTVYEVLNASDRLPTASTCVNLLKLPRYGSKETLREKLLFAIEQTQGFGLS